MFLNKKLFLILCFLSCTYNVFSTTQLSVTKDNLPIFYHDLKDDITFPLGWKENSNFNTWKQLGLEKTKEFIVPNLKKFNFNMEIVSEVDRGSYIGQKILFNITPNLKISALLLTPKGIGPFPAALMLHDHGAKFDIGKEKLIMPWGDEKKLISAQNWSKKYFSGVFPGDELTKKGYVVLAIDTLGWGERQGNGYEAQQALASNLFNLGTSYASIIAQEDIKSAEFLTSLPQVDKNKVAAIGFSMGAFRAWQVAALSENIKAGISVCWMATLKGLMTEGNNQLKGQSAYAMLHPYLVKYMDYPDIASLAAPKPMLFFNGEQDSLFPKPSVMGAFEQMNKVWKASGFKENFQYKFWNKGHVFEKEQQVEAFEWLDKQFKNK